MSFPTLNTLLSSLNSIVDFSISTSNSSKFWTASFSKIVPKFKLYFGMDIFSKRIFSYPKNSTIIKGLFDVVFNSKNPSSLVTVIFKTVLESFMISLTVA